MILLYAKAKADLFFNIVSFSVHILPLAMLESLDPCGIEPRETPPQQLSPPCLTGNANQLGAFSCLETENSLTELAKGKSSNKCLDLVQTNFMALRHLLLGQAQNFSAYPGRRPVLKLLILSFFVGATCHYYKTHKAGGC